MSTPVGQHPGGDPRRGGPVGHGGSAVATPSRPAPTRSNRSVLITIVAVVLVIGGGLSAWLLSTPTFDRTTARGAAEAFASAVNTRDLDAMEQVSCSDLRYELRRGSGQQLVENVTVNLQGVESAGDEGSATYAVSANLGSLTIEAALERDETSGLWTVCPDLGSL